MNKKLITAVSVAMLALPLVSMAFAPGNIPNVVNLSVEGLVDIIFKILWPIIVAFAIIMFILAAFQFFNAQGDPDKVAGARNFVIWGVVGMVVALLAFSIPFIVRNTLDSGI